MARWTSSRPGITGPIPLLASPRRSDQKGTMSIKRVFAAATTLGFLVTLAAPALSSPANANMTPISRMETVNAVNREPVQKAKGGGGGGGGHKPGGGGGGTGS